MDKKESALDEIQRLSKERHALWRKAGKGGLNPTETQRVQELTNRLEVAWDLHRREVAGDRRTVRTTREDAIA